MKNIVLFFIISLVLFSCTQKNPDNVQAILDKAGTNKVELQKVLDAYQEPEDSLKLQAAWFLLGNIDEQGYLYYEVADYLINHIDLAFRVWEENPWSKHLNFDQFGGKLILFSI